MTVRQHVLLLALTVDRARALVVQVLRKHQHRVVVVVVVLRAQHVEPHALLVLHVLSNVQLDALANVKEHVKVGAAVAAIPHVTDNVMARAQHHVEAMAVLQHAMAVAH